MDEKDDQNKPVLSLVWDFFGYTTAHGFARISESKTVIGRTLWCLLVGVAFVMFFIQVFALLETYLSRPIGTQIKMRHESSIPFPAVTICNLNIVKKSKISTELHGSFENFLQQHNESSSRRRRSAFFKDPVCFNYLYCQSKYKTDDANATVTEPPTTPPPTTTTAPTTTSPTTTQSTTTTTTTTTRPITQEETTTKQFTGPTEKVLTIEEKQEEAFTGAVSQPDPATLTKETRQAEELSVNLASQPEDVMIEAGHQFNDIVLSCTYRGISCTNYTEKLWSHFWHYKYGNCYIFNSGKDSLGQEQTILKSNKPGPSNGLILEMNAEQHEYVGQLTQEAGMRILISKQGEFPAPLEKGFSISPGYSTSAGMRQTKIIREDPFQNKSCLKDDDIDPENLYRIRYNVSYSPTTCKDSCLAYHQLQSCGCLEYRFPSQGKSICDIFDLSVIKCLNDLQMLYQENKLGCSAKCRPPCTEDIYKLTISSSRWPSENYQSQLTEKLSEERGVILEEGENPRAYFVKFQLFYEELNLEIIEEYLSYEVTNFISDIGGQLGLWIGISCLTAAEFVELVLLIIAHITSKIFHRKEESKSVEKTHRTEHIREELYMRRFSERLDENDGSISNGSITIDDYNPRLVNLQIDL